MIAVTFSRAYQKLASELRQTHFLRTKALRYRMPSPISCPPLALCCMYRISGCLHGTYATLLEGCGIFGLSPTRGACVARDAHGTMSLAML